MARSAIWLGALLLAACSGAPGANEAANVAAEAPAKPFVPMTAADIRAFLPGHYIDEGNYACLGGPILVLKDGTFDAMSEGSGRTGGDYVIGEGRIAFDDHGAPEHFAVTILLYRDRKGRPYYRYDGDTNDPKPARLKPADPGTFEALCKDGMPMNGNAA